MLDGEDEEGARGLDLPGVLALRVHLVCGDHRPGQVRDLRQQLAEDRDLVRLLDVDRELGGGGAVVPDPGQEHRDAPAAGGAAHRLPVDPQVAAHAGPQRAGPGSRPRAQRVVVLALVAAGQAAADGRGVRPARLPGLIQRRAQLQQQLLRCRRGPFRGRVQLPVPGHARDQRQRQQVLQRVDAALPPAQVVHRAQEPAQPRDLLIIPAGRHRFAYQFPPVRPPAGGQRAVQGRGQRGTPLRRKVQGQPGRQDEVRQRSGQHLRHRGKVRHHGRQHFRDQGTAQHGHGRLGHAGFLRGHGDLSQKNQFSPGNPASPEQHAPYPDALTP